MQSFKEKDANAAAPSRLGAGRRRRQFLTTAARAAGAIALGSAVDIRHGLAQSAGPAGPAVHSRRYTEWGWPLPYQQISAKSKQWLQSKGWWPLDAGWIVVWSGEEMIGHTLQTVKLLEKRGIETKWTTFVAAGYSNEAFIPGRIQLASTGALGVLALMANDVPTSALAVQSPCLEHAATVPLDSPLKRLADLKDGKVLKRPAVVGVTTGSTNHFGFLAAAHYLELKQDRDFTIVNMPPGVLATAPKGVDVYTNWEPHVTYSTQVLKVARTLESLNPYYIYSGYYYARSEIEDNAPDVVQLVTDAFVEAVLWAKANQEEAVKSLLRMSTYAQLPEWLMKKMSDKYVFWPKPTVYFPFDNPNGIWPKEEARISSWAYDTGASRTRVTDADWVKVRKPKYMANTFETLGWKVPERPPFLPKDWGGVGQLPYKPYGPQLLNGPAPFPEPGELTRPWTFMGKTYRP